MLEQILKQKASEGGDDLPITRAEILEAIKKPITELEAKIDLLLKQAEKQVFDA